MRCPSLTELPAPPEGRIGWPWSEESSPPIKERAEGLSWPRITIVTPSFNQGKFIEATIRSVLLQGYPNIEYFILDGGSTDNTVEIIRKYSPWIDFWASEPDRGQSSAINRGLRMGSGLHATWINSDDMLCKNALCNHFLATKGLREDFVFVGDCIHIDEVGNHLFTHRGQVESLEDLVRVPSVWRAGGSISQPEVLFPLELALRVGGLNEDNHYSMDYELWGEFLLAGAKLHYTGIPFGVFRRYYGQKTDDGMKQTESTLDAAKSLVAQASFSAEVRQEILAQLRAYWDAYPEKLWKESGRLARIGLPPLIVIPLRNLRKATDKMLGGFRASTDGSK